MSGPLPTLDPFLFCVYHKDLYPPGNTEMEAPFPGNGHDFDPHVPFRMYHGTYVPGFPQHPHRGFETITATLQGIIDHADSLGNAGRYGNGDVQWMTAGKGVVHSEMFPLLQTETENPTRFFQIWLNLESSQKMVKPDFCMHWEPTVPKVDLPDKVSVTLWAGQDYFGVLQNNAPPEASWARDATHDVAIFHITMQPGGSLVLPRAHNPKVNRSLLYLEGEAHHLVLQGQTVDDWLVVQLQPDQDVTISYSPQASEPGQLLVLQGQPIGEPVAQYGPFVMNTQAEIKQAFADYAKTKFGGWPWPRDDMVFERTKGRFAKFQGQEQEAPTQDKSMSCQDKDI
jgi:redox-sensitive bicupin YhaK (pirin superfamily)